MRPICAVFLFLVSSVYGQDKLLKQTVQDRIAINQPDSHIVAGVLPFGKKVKVNNELLYYWYKADRIRVTRGGYDGKPLHGEYKQFDGNQNLKEKGTFKKGLKSGTWKTWYPNGELKDVSNWKNGIRHGASTTYSIDHRLLQEQTYRKDKLLIKPIKSLTDTTTHTFRPIKRKRKDTKETKDNSAITIPPKAPLQNPAEQEGREYPIEKENKRKPFRKRKTSAHTQPKENQPNSPLLETFPKSE